MTTSLWQTAALGLLGPVGFFSALGIGVACIASLVDVEHSGLARYVERAYPGAMTERRALLGVVCLAVPSLFAVALLPGLVALWLWHDVVLATASAGSGVSVVGLAYLALVTLS